MTMHEIGIDIETKSGESLKYGVYKYVESPEFEILLFSYSINGATPLLIDLTRHDLPKELLTILQDETWLKTAHNAQFERICINKYFGLNVPTSQWKCTLVLCATLALPLSLDAASKVLKVTEKDRKGKDLIRYFSVPIKNPKDPFKLFHTPSDSPEKWESYKVYNKGDVTTEQEIKSKIRSFIPENKTERKLYILDQKINDYGVKVDLQLVKNAIRINKTYTERLEQEAKELTGVDNPHSVAQLKAWIKKEINLDVDTLNKNAKIETDNPKVLKLLELRKELSKTSIKKYLAMYKAASIKDNRIRGLFQYGGAVRTLRWAGRIVQPQNFVKNSKAYKVHLDFLRDLVKANNLEFLEAYTGDVNAALSQLLRTAFIPEEGNVFLINDFSAIEARVLSWYAKENWRLEVFKTHGLIYEATASNMFKIPIERVTKDSEERQKAKIGELALGYQGGIGALLKMGAEKMGLSLNECQNIVNRWRKANPKIVRFWYAVSDAIKTAIQMQRPQRLGKLVFEHKRGTLLIWLPSGRPLVYLNTQLDNNGRITYMGMHQTLKKWIKIESYGGKFVENITQATARDILGEAMLKIDEAGYNIAMHIHDEIVAEVPRGTAKKDLEIVDKIMSLTPVWAEGLPLKGEGYLSDYYKKED